jgi:hypothetical protein
MLNDLRRAHDEVRQAHAKLEEIFFRTFPEGSPVAWVVNGRNGRYEQFGTVVENEERFCIFVVNNKTQKRIRFEATSACSWGLRVVE